MSYFLMVFFERSNSMDIVMENVSLYNFLKLHNEANAIVSAKDNSLELITFNKHLTINEYAAFLEDIGTETFLYQIAQPNLRRSDYKIFLHCLKNQFSETFKVFEIQNGFLIHKKLILQDRYKHPILFENLPLDVKHKISSFISIQKSSLKSFIAKLDYSGMASSLSPSNLYWRGKTIHFLEVAIAFWLGGFIVSEKGPLTKKEFINKFAKSLNIEPGAWEVMLNKAMLRKNPTKFIDELKSTITKHYEQLNGNTNS